MNLDSIREMKSFVPDEHHDKELTLDEIKSSWPAGELHWEWSEERPPDDGLDDLKILYYKPYFVEMSRVWN